LPESEPLIAKRLQHYYFNGYWLKYDIQITICQPNDSLLIKPDNYKTECNEFFNKIVNNIGVPTLSSNFYYLNKETGRNSYLAIFNYPTDTTSSVRNKPTSIHIELDSKFIPKELGYPELLIDKELNINKDMSGYSYAKYKNGALNTQYGKYFYFLDTEFYKQYKEEFTFFTSDGYSHLLYKSDPTAVIIISKKQDDILDIIAPFSYLFSFLLVFVLIFLLIYIYPINSNKIYLSFKGRLQIAMISIVLFSFIFIGAITVYYIIGIYENKNVDNISEKAHSILVELENKLSDKENLTPESADFVGDLLVKFSNVFFTDINLFDRNGNLISSSRNKIFDEGMLSKRMDPIAFYDLSVTNRTFFIHNESIGKLKYISVYLPFRNNQNKVIGYLNIPYFAKQSELKKEISTFLVAFINVYVLLVAIAIIYALLISSYIARPLKLIRDKLSQIKLGKRNEKIQWSKEDELGLLITEYNRMIDELAKSAELLARSERESAWREMAKQVAHEIKNPLTPMKLSVQYLQKAWKENNTDWDERLDRFTHTMIEQIETLSLIASEFSNFANIAKVRNEKIDLIKLIDGAITLFKDFNIQISFEKQKGEKLFINADKTQMLRVFNNLIKNSIQAIDNKPDGKIQLSVKQKESFYLISITDNGCGIPNDQLEKIFTPNFTTKTGGMGLGLVMVKGIVDAAGGEIWFETQEKIGTTFFFTIPQISNN